MSCLFSFLKEDNQKDVGKVLGEILIVMFSIFLALVAERIPREIEIKSGEIQYIIPSPITTLTSLIKTMLSVDLWLSFIISAILLLIITIISLIVITRYIFVLWNKQKYTTLAFIQNTIQIFVFSAIPFGLYWFGYYLLIIFHGQQILTLTSNISMEQAIDSLGRDYLSHLMYRILAYFSLFIPLLALARFEYFIKKLKSLYKKIDC